MDWLGLDTRTGLARAGAPSTVHRYEHCYTGQGDTELPPGTPEAWSNEQLSSTMWHHRGSFDVKIRELSDDHYYKKTSEFVSCRGRRLHGVDRLRAVGRTDPHAQCFRVVRENV